jgi:hypothetical protein
LNTTGCTNGIYVGNLILLGGVAATPAARLKPVSDFHQFEPTYGYLQNVAPPKVTLTGLPNPLTDNLLKK